MAKHERLERYVTDPRSDEHRLVAYTGSELLVDGNEVMSLRNSLFSRVLVEQTLAYPDQPIETARFKEINVTSFRSLVGSAIKLNEYLVEDVGYYPWQMKFSERKKLTIPMMSATFYTTAANASSQISVPEIDVSTITKSKEAPVVVNSPHSVPTITQTLTESHLSASRALIWSQRVVKERGPLASVIENVQSFDLDLEVLYEIVHRITGVTIKQMQDVLRKRLGRPYDTSQVLSSMARVYRILQTSDEYRDRLGMHEVDPNNPFDGTKFYILTRKPQRSRNRLKS